MTPSPPMPERLTEAYLPLRGIAFLSRTAWGETGVPVIGTGLTATASQAALANGAASHAPELDDVVNSASLHPGVCAKRSSPS